MKVWILHDSVDGNGEKLAETLGATLTKTKVKIAHISNVTPEEVIGDKPDGLFVGTTLRKFQLNSASKKWLKDLKVVMDKEDFILEFGVSFLIHAMPRFFAKFWGDGFDNHFNRIRFISTYPEWISGRIQKEGGTFFEGELEKVKKIGKDIDKWMKN